MSTPSLCLWTGTHTRLGQHKNGDHTGSQPLVWAQGEHGKPIHKMNAARCKELNTCQKRCADQPWAYQGTRAARQLRLQRLSLPQWHWLKTTLDWILPCWPDYLAAAQLLISVFQARREMLTHLQKAKNSGTDWVGQALKTIFKKYIKSLKVWNYRNLGLSYLFETLIYFLMINRQLLGQE